ncbi:uncharacterized protein LOC128393708 [Panonychus citri]|uniref:uncharacterized protein LOC128393708 n=1 Tax=Panonychus citri TaxID=50023 RepID=UPI002306ED70|nr:uncharacterized protein LOC128393708 [Panonychus citri]
MVDKHTTVSERVTKYHHNHHHHHSVPLEDTTNRNILRIKRERRRQLRLREYQNLCKLIPSLNGLNIVPKVKIINEAVKYIDELHQQLIIKLAKEGSSESDIKAFKDNWINAKCQLQVQNNNTTTTSTPTNMNTTTTPTITTHNNNNIIITDTSLCKKQFDKQSKLKQLTQL